MPQLVSPFFDFIVLLQNPVHGADGTEVLFFVKKCCVYLLRGLVLKTLSMEHIKHLLFFRH
jgi:hypothetical protein